MRCLLLYLAVCFCLLPSACGSTLFSEVHGLVLDPHHHPVQGATVRLHAAHSSFALDASTDGKGAFLLPSVPLGDYLLTLRAPGFAALQQSLTLSSGTAPRLHFVLAVAVAGEEITVTAQPDVANGNSPTPTTLVGRQEIAQTPGADRTNSLAMITDFVPGAYITHDMLHMRGGHQVSWLLDGVEIPNTNIASNLGAQIDPKDIDYVEVQRGSYAADVGDRTYGAFNVVPRSGFERNREAELVLTAGNFLQTNDQVSFGDHTKTFAYYASLNGNRSDYGLSPPVQEIHHDQSAGYGGFASLLYNRSSRDQFRLIAQLRQDVFQVPYDPDPESPGNQQFDSSGLRDRQRETDAVVAASWLHTFGAATVLQVSPFFHDNRADYEPSARDTPVATTSDRASAYTGAQVSLTTDVAHSTLQAGLYGFAQHDEDLFGATFAEAPAQSFTLPATARGGVIETFLSDTLRPVSWLTLTAGLRHTSFLGQTSESVVDPRLGVALRLPRLQWVFRGFYGRFYQPPPLLTAAGPLVQLAQANNTSFQPLHGERDEEHQFGVLIPYRGWVLDVDTFKTRVQNFLDHSNLGDSSLYFPVTLDGALVRAWELSLRSPRLGRLGQAHLAYSNQIAEQRGNITGGLVCTPAGDAACDAGFRYTPVDHDQRNTLALGLTSKLPWRLFASADLAYGSGFVNGVYEAGEPPVDPRYPDPYLPAHTTWDLAIGKDFGDRLHASLQVLNVANRRILLDNSLTFGGFHFNDPRELYGEIRYRFRY